MSQSKPTYEELKRRCQAAEAMLEAIRSGQADTIIGEQGMLVLRLAKIEEALRLNRERLSLTLEAARAGTWEWNLQTNENIWSEELWPVYGLEPHSCQPSYEAWLQTIHPADRAGAAQAVQTAAANGTELNAQWRVLDPDGTARWLMSRGRPLRDAAGEVVRYIGIVFDITDHKHTEEALRESENTVRAWLNAIQESAFMMDRDGTILASNATTARRLHRSVEEMVGASIYDFLPPHNADQRRLHVAQVIESGQPVRFEDERTGRIFDHLIYPVFDQAGQVKHLAILGTDITERRQAHAALRQSEARYRLLAENMADVVWILNANSLRFTYVSPSVERLRGYSVAEVMAQPMDQVMTPDSLARINAGSPERLQAFLAGDPAAVTRTSEVEQTCKNGSTVWTEVVTTLLRNEADEIEVLGVSRDISARKQAEQASRLKDELLHLTGEMARVGGWEFDAKTLQGTWTDEVARIHDLDPTQPTNVEVGISFYLPESRQKIEQAIQEALELARPYDLELEIVSAKGQHKWVRTMGLPLSEGNRVIKVRGIFQDITERKQAEDALRESRLRLELALKGANAGLWDWYVQTGEAVFNQRWAEIGGYTLEELEPINIQTWINLCHPDDLARSDELLKQHFAGKTDFYECEARMRHKNGEWVWVLDRGQVVEWADSGQPIRMTGTHIDITERKRADEQLRESEARFHGTLDAMQEGVLLIGRDWRYLYVNKSAEMQGRRPAEELLGKTVMACWPGFEATDYFKLEQKVMQERLPAHIEGPFTFPDGETRWFHWNIQPAPEGLLIVTQDITERKQAERERRIALEKYRVLFETFPLGISVTDEVGNLIEVNRESERLLGLSRQNHLRRTYDGPEWRIVRPDGTPMPRDEFASVRALQEERLVENVEMGIVKGDGEITWINVTAVPLPLEGYGVVITYSDITERKRAEAALRESEERYRKLLELAPVAIAVHSDDKIVFINPAGVRLLGAASEEELIGRSVLDIIHPAGLNQVQERKTRLLAGEQGLYPAEDVYLKLDGAPINVEVTVTPLSYQGKPAFQAIITDITERKRAEDELNRLNAGLEQRVAERTAELSDLYNNAPCGYHSLDSNGVLVRINDTELAWLGYAREEVIGRVRFPDLLTPASIQTFAENFPVFKERGWVQDLEFDLVRKDGSILPVLLSASAVYDQTGHFLTSRSTMMDHTERKRAETALRESQAQLVAANKELEAFAYSVSHDLRAPLRGIDGWSLALLEDYGEQLDGAARQYLDRVRAEAQRMGRLIDDLLQLSRITRTEMHRSPVNLSTLAHIVTARLREMEPERQVEVVIQPDLTTSGDADLLEIVLTNLLGNAFKFSSRRAEARVEFGCLPHASPPSPGRRGEGGEVYFVCDNGAGFDMAYAAKLFGAFQRMHKVSEFPGTGIGLAIVQRIIHRHGGRVWAEAEVGRGAIFYFTLEEGL